MAEKHADQQYKCQQARTNIYVVNVVVFVIEPLIELACLYVC